MSLLAKAKGKTISTIRLTHGDEGPELELKFTDGSSMALIVTMGRAAVEGSFFEDERSKGTIEAVPYSRDT